MVNPKELQIITELRRNARESLTEISRHTHIPISTIYSKLLNFRGDIIKRHTSLLDFEALGYHTLAMVFISCEQSQREQLTNALLKSGHINSVFKLNNEYQLMFEGIFRYVADVDSFLDSLETRFKITKRKILYIAKELRREGFELS